MATGPAASRDDARLSDGEAEVAGEAVGVAIDGRLQRVFAEGGHWWARIALGGLANDIGGSIDVPLICVRLADRLYRRVEVPGASPDAG